MMGGFQLVFMGLGELNREIDKNQISFSFYRMAKF